MDDQPFLTNNQYAIIDALNRAATGQETVAVFDHPGIGFKHALNNYIVNDHHGLVKVALVSVHNNSYSSQLPIKISEQFYQIRFSNLNYKKADARDLIRVLGQRIKRDLLGKKILLVFENVDRLKTEAKLVRFMGIIKCINFKCGIIIRTTKKHMKKVEKMDEKVYTDFNELTKVRKVLPRNSPKDVELLCRIHGINNGKIIEEISESTTNFRIAMVKIKHFVGFRPTAQLTIPFV